MQRRHSLDTDLEILKSEKAVDFRKLINLALKEQLLKCYGEEERIFVWQSDATTYDVTVKALQCFVSAN